jgi:transposase
MQGKKEEQQKLFYTIGLDRLVPLDHPVRRIKEVLDLQFLYQETRRFYSTEGKPSIDPVVLFKLYLLGYLFGIQSERRLFREVQVNLAYRRYLGYDLDEPIPDHSIMSKSRQRFSAEVFERLFKHVVQLCREKGLISGDYYFLDSSIIRADASKESFRTKLRTEKEYLEGLEEESKPRNNFRGHIFDGTVDPDKMGKRRRKAKKNDRVESSTDPDAELVSRGGSSSLPAYKAHFCVDRRQRVILSIVGSKATEDDLAKIDTLFTESLFAIGKKPHTVVADSHYGGIEGLKYFQDKNVQTCIKPRIHDNSEGRFRNIDFKMIVDGQEMECPAGHRVRKQTNNLFRIQFHWPKQLCDTCPLKIKCTKSPYGRLVSLYKGEYFTTAQALAQSSIGRKLLRARQIIVEGVIGEAKNFHLLRRCKYRTLQRFRIQLWLTAAAMNLKRLMKSSIKWAGSGAMAVKCLQLTFSAT